MRAKLYDTTVTINGQEWPFPVKSDLVIHEQMLEQEYMDQPEKYGYYAWLAALARYGYEDAKIMVESITARRFLEIRLWLLSTGEKTTDAIVNNHVQNDGVVIEAKKAVAYAQGMMRQCEAARDSFAQRKEMLVSLGADRRNQLTGAPQIVTEERLRAANNFAQVHGK